MPDAKKSAPYTNASSYDPCRLASGRTNSPKEINLLGYTFHGVDIHEENVKMLLKTNLKYIYKCVFINFQLCMR